MMIYGQYEYLEDHEDRLDRMFNDYCYILSSNPCYNQMVACQEIVKGPPVEKDPKESQDV